MALTENVLQYRGQNLNDSSGEKIGKIEEIYLDTETNKPEWALINTGRFGTKSTFVPLRGATTAGGALRVGFDKAQVTDEPRMDRSEERRVGQEGRSRWSS